MLKAIAVASFVVATTVALGAVADGTGPSTFQYTCSNIRFEYANNRASVQGASLQAMCLRVDGVAVASTLMLPGISNQNGVLTP